jgi:uncharacterized membrane protein
MKTIRKQNRLSHLAALMFNKAAVAGIVMVLALVARVTPSASAKLPTFTSTVELRMPSGAPAGHGDVDTGRMDPVSAGYGAAGTSDNGAIRWAADGSATPLPRPEGYESGSIYAFGINNGGQVVGNVYPGRAVRWDTNGSPTLLNGAGPESYGTGANAINNLGQMVGEDYGGLPNGEVGAIRWAADGSATSLGAVPGHTTLRSLAYDISDTARVAGVARLSGIGDRAVRWDADGSATLLGVAPGQAGYSLTTGINNAGEAVGEAFVDSVLAVRWAADGSATLLDDLPGHITGLSQAWAITDDGLVAGYAYLADMGVNRAVIWDANGKPSMLQDLMADGNTWTFVSIEGIDADATRICALAVGSKNGGPFNYYFIEATVPEPATISLLSFSAFALLRRARRQAVEWTEKKQPINPQLRRFRTEAAEVLKIAGTQPATQAVK